MNIRRFGGVLLGAAALIVVPVVPTGATTGASTGATAGATAGASTVTAVASCTGADLHASRGRLEGAAGSRYLTVRVTNVADHACLTAGYTRYRFRNPAGLIGYPSVGNPVDDGAAPLVLSRGETARSVLSWVDPGPTVRSECLPRRASAVRLHINDVDRFYRLPIDVRVCTTKKYRPHATRLS